MSATHENVHTMTGSKPETDNPLESRDAIIERLDRAIGPTFLNLAGYIRYGRASTGLYASLIDDAAAIAELLVGIDSKSDEITDKAVNKASDLLYRILWTGQEVHSYEIEQEFARRDTKREQAEREREERDQSPAGRVDFIGFLSGMSERSRGIVEADLEALEAQDAKAAEIVRERLEAGPGAVLFVADDGPSETTARLVDSQGDDVNQWFISHETAAALWPLAQNAA